MHALFIDIMYLDTAEIRIDIALLSDNATRLVEHAGKMQQPIQTSNMTGWKKCALQVPTVVPYKAIGKALYGTKGGTCSARFFRPVMFC